MDSILPSVHVSAPGKVLITGGYLVLIPPASGLVLSTTARFHSWVTLRQDEQNILQQEHVQSTSSNNSNLGNISYTVESPQFKKVFEYKLLIHSDYVTLHSESKNSQNPFIELPILYAQLEWWKYPALLEQLPQGLHVHIKIEADNDYYSQSEGIALTLDERKALPERRVPDVWPIQKTGLGSSAGLVTSLVAGIRSVLKQYIGDDGLDTERDIHRLAQFVHGLAQGKVGSGFDVSAAVYGSQRYLRFPPQVLQSVMNKSCPDSRTCTREYKKEIEFMLHNDSQWKYSRTLYALPHGFNLFVADVKGGSETPGMVRKVLHWKESHEGANELWNHIDTLNQKLDSLFESISVIYSEKPSIYENTLDILSNTSVDNWNKITGDTISKSLRDLMLEVRSCFIDIRSSMKRMGNESNVEIEPNSQTTLLNETMNTNGCLIAGVPGAGGYDAIFSIIFGANSRDRIENVWRAYSEKMNLVISPLTLEESKYIGIEIEDLHRD